MISGFCGGIRSRSILLGALGALLLTGCGGSSGGRVTVLYAGSLVDMMEHDLGPAFSHATGYGYQGFGAGSTEVAAEIKGHVRQGDVFISASDKADKELEGRAGGNFVTWYIVFARAPLVIAYNPHSRFASQFRRKPWYQVITQPGIRVGRTDPKLDPKGELTVKAVDEAASKLGRPALTRALGGSAVFPEETLVGRLDAGQLDAGFFYSNEARDQHLPTVPLTPVNLSATFTVTILRGAANPSGAQSFIRYLLGTSGRTTLSRHGMIVLRPTLAGATNQVPQKLRALARG